MQQKRIQNRISESRWTLSAVVPAALLVWVAAALHTTAVIAPGICLLLSTYLMMELNNANALIRIYSRMVSCSFLVLTTMAVFQFPSIRAAIVTLSIVGFYTPAFRCYQDPHSPGWMFYAYFCIGMASIVWVQALFFLPILWIVTRTNLLAMSPRNFVASLLGIALPYWFFTAYLAATGNISLLADHFRELAAFSKPLDLSSLTVSQITVLAYVLLCAVIGTVHFLNQKRNDSIRTRLLYQIFITVDIAATLFLFLQPQHYEALLGILIVTTSPLIGHFFALTRTRITNWIFCILSTAALIITLINLWMFLHTSF
ncbi:MAG: hypothetical protein K6A82_03405 [Prevotella sp.]|nr:hypothetical protein [Prevotella sp.]